MVSPKIAQIANKIETNIPLLNEVTQEYLCHAVKYKQFEVFKYICEFILPEAEKKTNNQLDIAGPDPNYIFDRKNFIFIYVCMNGHLQIVKYLLENYSNKINIADKENGTFIDACGRGQILVVKYLLDNYGDLINIADILNDILLSACSCNNILVVKYLLENYYGSINIADNLNMAFTVACSNNSIDIVKYLCEEHINKINIAYDSNMAFIIAYRWMHIEIVKYLCENHLETYINNKLNQADINCAFEFLISNDIICDNLIEYIDQDVYENRIGQIAIQLIDNTAEYYILTRNLAKRKYKKNVIKKIPSISNEYFIAKMKKIKKVEEMIEKKYQMIQFFENAPPVELKGQLSKNYEEGLNFICKNTLL